MLNTRQKHEAEGRIAKPPEFMYRLREVIDAEYKHMVRDLIPRVMVEPFGTKPFGQRLCDIEIENSMRSMTTNLNVLESLVKGYDHESDRFPTLFSPLSGKDDQYIFSMFTVIQSTHMLCNAIHEIHEMQTKGDDDDDEDKEDEKKEKQEKKEANDVLMNYCIKMAWCAEYVKYISKKLTDGIPRNADDLESFVCSRIKDECRAIRRAMHEESEKYESWVETQLQLQKRPAAADSDSAPPAKKQAIAEESTDTPAVFEFSFLYSQDLLEEEQKAAARAAAEVTETTVVEVSRKTVTTTIAPRVAAEATTATAAKVTPVKAEPAETNAPASQDPFADGPNFCISYTQEKCIVGVKSVCDTVRNDDEEDSSPFPFGQISE